MRLRNIVIAVGVLAATAVPAAHAASSGPVAWSPGAAAFGVAKTANIPVTMTDGTVLRVDVYRPAQLAGGPSADGPFPVLLSQTPYGKNGPLGTADNYLVSRGYIEVFADIRGRGNSQGNFEAFGPREIQDGVELVKWSANLPGTTHEVGMIGCSYLGINQLLTAEAIGPHSPLKAIFPQSASNSNFRDLSNVGGMPSAFAAVMSGALLPVLGTEEPITDYSGDPGDTALVEAQHAGYLNFMVGSQVANQTGSSSAPSFYNQFWDLRDPGNHLDRVVANDIPTFLTEGSFDLFQRGGTMNYAGLQNAVAHRPVDAAMAPKQEVSGKYQLIQGPWYHCDGDRSGQPGSNVDVEALQLRWFDRWLKHDHNGIDTTSTPLHLWEQNASRWIDTDVWPVTGATTYYLGGGPSSSSAVSVNDGTLSPHAPALPASADTLVWDGAAAPCATAVPALSAQLRCSDDDRRNQAGPNALTYTMDAGGKTLAGAIDATIFLTSTSSDAELTATIDDVAPDGTSVPVTGGALIGSGRALDPKRSWTDSNGKLVNPYHPFTAETQKPIGPGEVARLDIEIFGTSWRFAEGHKLRLSLKTSAAPWALPTAAQTTGLVGGLYQVQRNQAHASFVNLPLLDTSHFTGGCAVCAAP